MSAVLNASQIISYLILLQITFIKHCILCVSINSMGRTPEANRVSIKAYLLSSIFRTCSSTHSSRVLLICKVDTISVPSV